MVTRGKHVMGSVKGKAMIITRRNMFTAAFAGAALAFVDAGDVLAPIIHRTVAH